MKTSPRKSNPISPMHKMPMQRAAFLRKKPVGRHISVSGTHARLANVCGAIVHFLGLKTSGAISASLRRVIHHEYTSLALFDEAKNMMRVLALDFPQGKGLIHEEMLALFKEIFGGNFRFPMPPIIPS